MLNVECDVVQERWWIRGEVVEARAVTFSRVGAPWLTSSIPVSPRYLFFVEGVLKCSYCECLSNENLISGRLIF
jgi:hypothetical protein